jgi:hypothetical protein
MSDMQNIDTPHERRPFKEHGHMNGECPISGVTGTGGS